MSITAIAPPFATDAEEKTILSETVGDLTITAESAVSVKIGDESWSLASDDITEEFNSRPLPGRKVAFRLLAREYLVLDVAHDRRRVIVDRPPLRFSYHQEWELEYIHPEILNRWVDTVAIRSPAHNKYLAPGFTIHQDIPVFLSEQRFPWKLVPIKLGLFRAIFIFEPYTNKVLVARPTAGSPVTLEDKDPNNLLGQVWVIRDI